MMIWMMADRSKINNNDCGWVVREAGATMGNGWSIGWRVPVGEQHVSSQSSRFVVTNQSWKIGWLIDGWLLVGWWLINGRLIGWLIGWLVVATWGTTNSWGINSTHGMPIINQLMGDNSWKMMVETLLSWLMVDEWYSWWLGEPFMKERLVRWCFVGWWLFSWLWPIHEGYHFEYSMDYNSIVRSQFIRIVRTNTQLWLISFDWLLNGSWWWYLSLLVHDYCLLPLIGWCWLLITA